MAAAATQDQTALCLQRVSRLTGAGKAGAVQGEGSKEVRLKASGLSTVPKKQVQENGLRCLRGFGSVVDISDTLISDNSTAHVTASRAIWALHLF